MNGMHWRTQWDLELIEREWRDARRERQRAQHDAGMVPPGLLTPLCLKLGGALIATGQRLAGEPGPYRSHAPNAV